MSESTQEQQLQEYESQLEEVQILLQASPDDPSLLSLKADLEELISITKNALIGDSVARLDAVRGGSPASLAHDDSLSSKAATAPTTADFAEIDHSGGTIVAMASTAVDAKDPQLPTEPPKKKAKKIKEFEVPQHLIVLDSDTDAEANRKRRALKALKSKWRERKKEVETEQKQKSWQSFQKKAKVGKGSMFSTHGGDSKVGVVTTGRTLTQSGERKRHNIT